MVDLIYTTDGKLLISKQIHDWKTWQNHLPDYMTHINFNNLDECMEFLQTDFNLQTIEIQNIEDFIMKSSQAHFEIDIKEDKSIQIKNLVLNI
ncbi:hypothetical protein [Capnocytophaga catalasegens]|uniref:Uncharacterized protein n=1 Tax=Capnocytophaga catalasegens TaxID=1004260 RepID=A0AAV5AUP5_9FLAO|nr:hypothetical protein [Capnocytophaga catalasegens]GIZ16262.1 hypothetical protein RCZ03_22620 [Capnocytophaga catalasegens]GJM51118.1 hypothetical protein RCZ15_20910 [Capnocytophaga catalasegens]GJM53308.1 hypothetical protein RCZ16_16250 [Capnocytophaga catalasegens]